MGLTIRRTFRRGVALLLVPFGLLCLAFPALQLFLADDSDLIDDSRAWFGAGTGEGVPEVSRVGCLKRRYGSSSQRGVGISEWSCTLYLTPARSEADPDAFATPAYLERTVPTDRTGDIPTLRRLSAKDAPPRFGVVWSGGEIALRWLHWALLAALFIGIGAACLYAARTAWRRSA